MSKILKLARWVGVDWADKFFNLKSELMPSSIDCNLIKGDFFNLSTYTKEKSFDIAFSLQTLSWLPSYQDALSEIFKITKSYIFISSLLTEYHVDIINNVSI